MDIDDYIQTNDPTPGMPGPDFELTLNPEIDKPYIYAIARAHWGEDVKVLAYGNDGTSEFVGICAQCPPDEELVDAPPESVSAECWAFFYNSGEEGTPGSWGLGDGWYSMGESLIAEQAYDENDNGYFPNEAALYSAVRIFADEIGAVSLV